MARKSRKQLDTVMETAAVPERVFFNAAAYVRLSCDDTKKRGDSLETQRNIIENFTATTPDIRLIDVYTDNDMTGTNFERPGFQRILADAQSGKINCIIVKDLTRFGRNAIDSGYYIERVFPMLGVRFIAVTDSFDSQNDNGGLLLPLKNIISESYALDIGRKCRAVQRQNMLDGRFVGRLAPYGYKKSPDDCHKLIVDDETADTVRQIFDWAVSGVGGNEIARRLSAAGIPSPSHRNHAKGFNSSEKLLGTVYWKSRTVKDMLADRVYVGDMSQGKTRTVNNKQIRIDPSEWVCVPNTHEPIISLEIFDRVQALREENGEQVQAVVKTAQYTPNVLRGKVLCARCGYPMHRHKQQNHDYYWFRCESQWKYAKDACTVVSVKESDLKAALLLELNRHSAAIRIIAKDAVDSSGVNAAAEVELRGINRELADMGRYLKSLYENLASGLITADEYTRMKADYQAKIEALSNRADEIRNQRREAEMRASKHRDISEAVSAAINGEHLTTELIDRLVDKILVNSDKSFQIVFRFDTTNQGECLSA